MEAMRLTCPGVREGHVVLSNPDGMSDPVPQKRARYFSLQQSRLMSGEIHKQGARRTRGETVRETLPSVFGRRTDTRSFDA